MSRAKHLRQWYIAPSTLLHEGGQIRQSSGEPARARHRATRERRVEARLTGYPKHSKSYPPTAEVSAADTGGRVTTWPA
jgi:hypothetical protein